jgi:hypothetical protein
LDGQEKWLQPITVLHAAVHVAQANPKKNRQHAAVHVAQANPKKNQQHAAVQVAQANP